MFSCYVCSWINPLCFAPRFTSPLFLECSFIAMQQASVEFPVVDWLHKTSQHVVLYDALLMMQSCIVTRRVLFSVVSFDWWAVRRTYSWRVFSLSVSDVIFFGISLFLFESCFDFFYVSSADWMNCGSGSFLPVVDPVKINWYLLFRLLLWIR